MLSAVCVRFRRYHGCSIKVSSLSEIKLPPSVGSTQLNHCYYIGLKCLSKPKSNDFNGRRNERIFVLSSSTSSSYIHLQRNSFSAPKKLQQYYNCNNSTQPDNRARSRQTFQHFASQTILAVSWNEPDLYEMSGTFEHKCDILGFKPRNISIYIYTNDKWWSKHLKFRAAWYPQTFYSKYGIFTQMLRMHLSLLAGYFFHDLSFPSLTHSTLQSLNEIKLLLLHK